MYITEIVWWGYTLFVLGLAAFMLVFAYKVQEKGE